MRLRRLASCAVLPLVLAGGCLLPSFDNVPGEVDAEGGGPTGDEGGTANVAGGQDMPQGGAAGEAQGDVLAPEADSYILAQGKMLTITASAGVLSNDLPSGLSVADFDDTDPDRPKELDAEVEIKADGSLTFTPAAAYFGRYVASYTVKDAAGQTASASVTFIVKPTAVELATVASGAGGSLLTGSAGEGLGTGLAALGDVNGDGYDDFAVAAPGGADGNGAIYVVFGRSDFGALSLGTLADSSKESRYAVLAGSPTHKLSSFVSSAGNFNSDKLADIAVGAPNAPNGTLYVVFGGEGLKTTLALGSMEAARGIAISGAVAGEQLGLHVAGGGDFNGDEKADLLSGIYPDGLTQGAICTVLENPIVDATVTDLEHRLVPDSSLFDLPTALAFAGDINGDGKDDVLASSKRHVALLFGQAGASVPTDISKVNTEGFGIVRTRAGVLPSVAAVAAAGDVNGDKHADFAFCDEFSKEPRCLVHFKSLTLSSDLSVADWELGGFAGAPALPLLATGADLNQDGFADLLLADSDAAYVVFGRETGFGAVDVSSLGADGFSLAAESSGSLAAIATIGDVNGDGYGDFALGEPSAASSSGQVYVILGGPFSADQH